MITFLVGAALVILVLVLWRRTEGVERMAARIAALDAEVAALRAELRARVSPASPEPAPGPPPARAAAPPAPGPAEPFRTFAAATTPSYKKTAAPAPAPEAASSVRIEERVAARLPVWIGSFALFLAGAFLVKYSFDRGLLGPAARVTLGVLFGLLLLGGGEFLRRRTQRIAQGLTGAGIAVLYASLLAATSLYGLIPRPLGFGLVAATTAAAVLLSLRQGPLVAVLGLLGGFLAPVLIGSNEPHPPALFGYLFLLQTALYVLARVRNWTPLAVSTAAAAGLWAFCWILLGPVHDALTLGLFLLGSLALLIALVPRRGFVLGSGLVTQLLLLQLTARGNFGTTEWVFLGLLAAGCLVLGRLRAEHDLLPWGAAAAGLIALATWGVLPGTVVPPRFLAVAIAYGALVVAGSYICLWGAARPRRWAALSACGAVAYTLLAYARYEFAPGPEANESAWAIGTLAVAGLVTALAVPIARRGAEGLGLYTGAAAVLAGAAAAIRLDHFHLTVAWALVAAALAWLSGTLRQEGLRPLAACFGAAVLLRLLVNPSALEGPIGTLPIFNGLLYGYGASALALAVAAWLWRRHGAPQAWSDFAEGGAAVLVAALLAVEVRHAFLPAGAAPATLLRNRLGVAETGLIVTLWAAFGLVLLAAGRRWPRRALEISGHAIGVGSLVVALGLLGVAVNPLLRDLPVGATPVVNALLVAYGFPALLALLLAREIRRRGNLDLARALGVFSLGSSLVLVLLEVRQAFHGTLLTAGATTSAETYAYSAALIVLGLLLLAAAIVTEGTVARWGSLAVILLAVAKVFLYDLSELRDLYRVFSFLGLGVSLLLVAYLYQRYVFASSRS